MNTQPQLSLPPVVERAIPACPYQVQGYLLTGEQAVICMLAEGYCPLQARRPTTAGRDTAVCLLPLGVHCDWQQVNEDFGGTDPVP
jgi:hypothetical protein